MYKISFNDINRAILACKHYANQSGSEWMYDEYMNVAEKLQLYLEQNFELPVELERVDLPTTQC